MTDETTGSFLPATTAEPPLYHPQRPQDVPTPLLNAAFARAQGEFKEVAKNREVTIKTKTGGQYKFRYADLQAIYAAVRPALAANELALTQIESWEDNEWWITTRLLHSSGEKIESKMMVPTGFLDPADQDVKQLAGLFTYIRRYAASAMLCIAADDDLDDKDEDAGKTQELPEPVPPDHLIWSARNASWFGTKSAKQFMAGLEAEQRLLFDSLAVITAAAAAALQAKAKPTEADAAAKAGDRFQRKAILWALAEEADRRIAEEKAAESAK
jgi:hypothetical protein